MTAFLAYADHFGRTIQIIGTTLALFFIALIAAEAGLRSGRKCRNEARLRARCDEMISRLQRRRAF